MHVQLLRDWKGYHSGKLFPQMPDGAANVLIRRGIAKQVRPPARRKKRARNTPDKVAV